MENKTKGSFYQRGAGEIEGIGAVVILGLVIAGILWFFGFNFGITNQGTVTYSDCRQVITLQSGSWQTYFHSFTCSDEKTQNGAVMDGQCVATQNDGFFGSGSCATAYVYQVPMANTCQGDTKNGVSYPYLGYDDQCYTTPQGGESAISLPQNTVPQTTNTSITLPVTILPTSDGLTGEGMYADKYPTSVDVNNAADFANQIAAYGTAYNVWIAPEGWTGQGGSGVDGNASATLYPTDGSANSNPQITYTVIPACVGCMLDAAAPFFANAMAQDTAMDAKDGISPPTAPQGLVVTPISSTLVTYTLPDEGDYSVNGVAYYGANNQYGYDYFEGATFILPTSESALSAFLAQTFISREKLQ